MKILLISMFYADAGKHLSDRAFHLFEKQGVTRWVFGVRPHFDCTDQMLRACAQATGRSDNCEIYIEPAAQKADRIERLSAAGDALLATLADEDYVLWHESDLFTPQDVVTRLARLGADAAGGWPTLGGEAKGLRCRRHFSFHETVFYDTWGYRKGGVRFGSKPPYHDCYRPEPFALDSVGSVVLIKADYIRKGARMDGQGVVGLCDAVRARGGTVMCDPSVEVIQPVELWTINND